MDKIEGYRGLVNGEEIMLIGDVFLVKSASRPRVWYEIEGDQCGCEAARHGNECHHVRNLRRAAPTSEEVAAAEGTGR